MLDWTKKVNSSASKQTNEKGDKSMDGKHTSEQQLHGKDERSTSRDRNDDHRDLDVEIIPGAGEECDLPADHAVIIIGDNWEKNIKPRDMRSNNQVKSPHLFSYNSHHKPC